MKKLILVFILLFFIKASCQAQLYIETTPIDSLTELPNISVTIQTSYWQGEQKVKDYSMDIGMGKKMKLKNVSGETVKIQSLVGLIKLLHNHGWEMQGFSVIPYNTVKTGIDTYINELLYTVIFRRRPME